LEVLKNFEKVRTDIITHLLAGRCFSRRCSELSIFFQFTFQVDAGKVSPASRFKEDLDLDSLDAVEVVMAIEEEFSIEIPDSEADKILSIPDAVAYISGHPMAK
jgi:acyl carrier protein